MTETESSDREGEQGNRLFRETDPPHACNALVNSLDENGYETSAFELTRFTGLDYFADYVHYALHALSSLAQ